MTGWFDHLAFEYFASKRDAERVVEGCGIPWTTLRATQFHNLASLTLEALAKQPAGYVPDLGGPTVYAFGDLLRWYLVAAGLRRLIVPMRLPGAAARAIRAGANLALDHADGRRTWEEFLAGHMPVRA